METPRDIRTPRWNYNGHAGTLKVMVVGGHDLRSANASSDGVCTASDPYVFVSVADQRLRTPIIRENNDPVWNSTLSFGLDAKHLSGNAILTVFDYDEPDDDGKHADCSLGKLTIPLSQILENESLSGEFIKSPLAETPQGMLSVKLLFLPARKF